MATKTRALLDEGLLSAAGSAAFKQLPDGRWACFFMFGGKKGRILPSEATGWLIRRVSGTSVFLGASVFLGWVTFAGAKVPDPWMTATDLTARILLTLATGFAAYSIPVVTSGLWLRRRYRGLPTTNETLSREEGRYQARIMAWIGFAAAALFLWGAGVTFAANQYTVFQSIFLLVGGTTIAGLSAFHLNQLIRAAHR